MRAVKIAVMGGCHVAGWPIGPDRAFPALLEEALAGTLVMQTPNVQFVRLPEQLARLEAAHPSHVVLQLGNYEFSPSLRSILTQFKRELTKQSKVKRRNSGSSSSSSTKSPLGTIPAPLPSRIAYYTRLVGIGFLTATLWCLSTRHQQAFRALNAYMRQHPATSFIMLSPFPCVDPVATRLRRWGGWLLRQRLAVLPNVQWLDSHQLLGNNNELFVDQLHLNEKGHQFLAQGLAAAYGLPHPVSVECLAYSNCQ
ncbi:MAG: SGNH/GDSL hydrolase family protein [Janthinobacterium lividum]